jgi:hypothetical protein
MALCALLAFWSGGDERQIDRLFRESGLMRGKWDERHYADGSTYGEKTIERVIAGPDEFYDPDPEPEDGRAGDEPFDAERASGADEVDPHAEAAIHRFRQERDELEAREQDHLELIDDLRSQVERLEAENERLRTELEERPDRTAEKDEESDPDANPPRQSRDSGSGLSTTARTGEPLDRFGRGVPPETGDRSFRQIDRFSSTISSGTDRP